MTTSHVAYIIAAYGFALLIVGGLIVRAVVDYRAQMRALADFEARGVHRRSRRKSAT
ncbi:heme exporter protein CcmD [Pseudochelatococcus sp. G4_1912]|uniref:heme exporter protein CcmD n=1 Tax=Pseudochelatococcus sp. G4_1912 TaxID=3114288 RepID=UPI0039C73095